MLRGLRRRRNRARQTYRALWGAALTGNAIRPWSRTNPAAFWSFVFGWHVAEQPLVNLAVQSTTAAWGLRRGRWRTADGAVSAAVTVVSGAGLLSLHRDHVRAGRVVAAALVDGLGADHEAVVAAGGLEGALGPPVRPTDVLPSLILRRQYVVADGLCYGPAGTRNLLDVWRGQEARSDRAPVLLQIPGGGWVYNDRRYQAYPLLSAMAKAGWVCVSINYRVSPRATWPDHIVDVKRAIAWVKANIADYGGDPDFVVITGGSAGGHLSSLAALTANDPEFQPGFEDVDTRVQAGVPFYGVYDLADWTGHGGPKQNVRHVERFVLKSSPVADAERWRRASPIHRVRPDAPPMMFVHGANDSLAPVERARDMAAALRSVSTSPVVYVELPRAQHAFDTYASLRTRYTVRGIQQFLAYVRLSHLAGRGAADQSVAALSSSKEADSASA
jgi:acetyl esterase/lipase